jgi:hypothetical protein
MRNRPAVLAATLALLLLPSAFAQMTGSLRGTVTAGAGTPLQGVVVTVTSPALQQPRSTTTGESGAYEFAALIPGDYQVTFARDGYQSRSQRVTLDLSRTARFDAELTTVVSDAIVVSAPPPSVLETPAVTTSLPLRMMERLPIQRNQLASSQLAPGVNANTVPNGNLQISGAPGYDNLVLVNGVVVTENTRGQIRPMYVEDAIQETTLLTGAISAEYGRFTGGVVNTITRMGGSKTDVSLRDSLSNPLWSAQTPAREARENNLNHVFEAVLGGDLLPERLWYFTAARWAKNDTARQTVAIPAFATPASPASPALSYAESNDQKRFEAKLTSTLTSRQQLSASYFKIDTQADNARFSNSFYDAASLSTRSDPESLISARYELSASTRLLGEAQYSRRSFATRAAASLTDIVGGTVVLDRANGNARLNAPNVCGACEAERRDNDDILLKAHYFADTGRAGTHYLVGGADRFTEQRLPNSHQSGSDFSLFVTRVQYKDGVVYPVVTPTTAQGGGTFIRWTPVSVAAAANELRTDSLFLNDNWDVGRRWSFSLGARYDRNHAADADGTVNSGKGRVVPRLSVQYDLSGDGRRRLTASYSEYSSRIADSIASSNQVAGNAGQIDFAYKGPGINAMALSVPLQDVLRNVFQYFNTMQGGTANTTAANLRASGSRTVPGYATYFDGTLAAPYVREVTVGYGAQLGAKGFARVDLIHRDWHDLYGSSVTGATRRATTPFGIPVDLTLVHNSSSAKRNYDGVQLQARWNATRFDAGTHYTYAKLRGNDEEIAAGGAVANPEPGAFYPEFIGYARNAPAGYLAGDQRHRLRAWAGYELPLPPAAGSLHVSLLQNFDSALSYSAVAPINVTAYAGAPASVYSSVPNGQYFLSGRGALRVDDIFSTDLALRYSRRFGGLELFAQGDLLNAFNRHGIADPRQISTTISTAATSATFVPFNPFTAAPIECPIGAVAQTCRDMGANFQRAANFGQPLSDLAYQRPRMYRFSFGVRY